MLLSKIAGNIYFFHAELPRIYFRMKSLTFLNLSVIINGRIQKYGFPVRNGSCKRESIMPPKGFFYNEKMNVSYAVWGNINDEH